jgi:hypothetical protein
MTHCLVVPLLLTHSSHDENGLLIMLTGHLAYKNHQIRPNCFIKGSVWMWQPTRWCKRAELHPLKELPHTLKFYFSFWFSSFLYAAAHWCKLASTVTPTLVLMITRIHIHSHALILRSHPMLCPIALIYMHFALVFTILHACGGHNFHTPTDMRWQNVSLFTSLVSHIQHLSAYSHHNINIITSLSQYVVAIALHTLTSMSCN